MVKRYARGCNLQRWNYSDTSRCLADRRLWMLKPQFIRHDVETRCQVLQRGVAVVAGAIVAVAQPLVRHHPSLSHAATIYLAATLPVLILCSHAA
ncbi:hypothetical protein F4778DRAFT_716000 [Xylariomycetidae sp. FL2044]|nr:hypothetical protein F4778DRAFT_716000 [Xylariomycetidae sp. FL2044]